MTWRAAIVVPRLAPSVVGHLLAALTRINYDLIRERSAPLLYRSGVVYQAEGRDAHGMREDWRTIPVVREMGAGDCEDLACWRAAELWMLGEPNAAAVSTSRAVPGLGVVYHIVVRRADGTIEDPSKRLGM